MEVAVGKMIDTLGLGGGFRGFLVVDRVGMRV